MKYPHRQLKQNNFLNLKIDDILRQKSTSEKPGLYSWPRTRLEFTRTLIFEILWNEQKARSKVKSQSQSN